MAINMSGAFTAPSNFQDLTMKLNAAGVAGDVTSFAQAETIFSQKLGKIVSVTSWNDVAIQYAAAFGSSNSTPAQTTPAPTTPASTPTTQTTEPTPEPTPEPTADSTEEPTEEGEAA
jgi:hypothetical protein